MWDVDDMDDATVDFILAMAMEYPAMVRHADALEEQRMAWLKSHPTYGKFGLLVN